MIISISAFPHRDLLSGHAFNRRNRKLVKASGFIIVFGLIIGLLYSGHDSDSIVVAEPKNPQTQTSSLLPTTPSIDQVAATNLAADLASIAELPISSNVSNQAISLTTKSELAQNDDDAISKPQIIQPTTAVARGVTTYRTHVGDTVDSVASQFKLSKDTIKWSNDLQSDALEPGRDLIIPPVDGVVSAAQPGDTITSLAQKYNTDAERIALYNDVDASGVLQAGTKVVIPGGVKVEAPAPVRTAVTGRTGASTPAFNINAILATGNRYDYGYCTWYAYNRRAALGRPISGLWGDASSWATLAARSGFRVDKTPEVGAVMQNGGGLGHVAVVESIGTDGSVFVSEMNYVGWNVKSTRTIPASQAGSYNYIH